MTLPNFGIPDTTAKLAAVDDSIGANQTAIQEVVAALAQPVQQAILSNTAGIDKTVNSLSRSLNGRVTANNTRLKNVIVPIGQTIGQSIANNNVYLTQAQASTSGIPGPAAGSAPSAPSPAAVSGIQAGGAAPTGGTFGTLKWWCVTWSTGSSDLDLGYSFTGGAQRQGKIAVQSDTAQDAVTNLRNIPGNTFPLDANSQWHSPGGSEVTVNGPYPDQPTALLCSGAGGPVPGGPTGGTIGTIPAPPTPIPTPPPPIGPPTPPPCPPPCPPPVSIPMVSCGPSGQQAIPICIVSQPQQPTGPPPKPPPCPPGVQQGTLVCSDGSQPDPNTGLCADGSTPQPCQPAPQRPPQPCPPGWTQVCGDSSTPDPNTGLCADGSQPTCQPPQQQQPPSGGGTTGCVADYADCQAIQGIISAVSSPIGQSVISGLFDSLPFGVGSIFAAAVPDFGAAYAAATSQLGCNLPTAGGIIGVQWLVGFLREWTGLDVPAVTETLNYWLNISCPWKLPSEGDTTEIYLFDGIDDNQAQCWYAAHGLCWDYAQKIIQARREKLTTDEYIAWSKRNGRQDNDIIAGMRQYGWTQPDEAGQRVDLSHELPTISDFLHFLTRNVYDDDYVNTYNLMEGYEERWVPKFGDVVTSIGVDDQWQRYHYAAHWINPAPGQLREFVWRLRPGKPGVENETTQDDFERLLTEQDIAPWARARFLETIYHVPALGYLRDMYRNNIIDDEELQSYHQDLGYSSDDSDNFVAVDKLVKARIRASEMHGMQPSTVASAYALGLLDDGQVQSIMEQYGAQPAEIDALKQRGQIDLQRSIMVRARSRLMFAALTQITQCLDVGTCNTDDAQNMLSNLGWPNQLAQGWVQLQQVKAQNKLIGQAKNRVRSSYLSGAVTIDQARASLSTLGLDPANIAQTIAIWQVEFTPKRKQIAAAGVVKHLALGDILTAEAVVRLANLGYSDPDVRLYLADAQRQILQRQQRSAAASQRSQLQAARELARLEAQAARQQQRLAAARKSLEPRSTLDKWAAQGLIGQDYYVWRMRTYGYSESEATTYYQSACEAKNAACVQTNPDSPLQPGTNGGAS